MNAEKETGTLKTPKGWNKLISQIMYLKLYCFELLHCRLLHVLFHNVFI